MKIDNNIESHLIEKRVFKPSKDFAKRAQIKSLDQYRRMYREAISRPDKFWGSEAKELTGQKQWKKGIEWKVPFAKWFGGGKLNLSENCLERNLASPRGKKTTILCEGE